MKKRSPVLVFVLVLFTCLSLCCDKGGKASTSSGGEWDGLYGGAHNDKANSIIECEDGGYIAAGLTKSFGKGKWDAWIVRLDEEGEELWSKTFGKEGDDEAFAIREFSDGFLVSGFSDRGESVKEQAWIFKINGSGDKLWEKFYGGEHDDSANSLVVNPDGSMVFAGVKKLTSYTNSDLWVVSISSSGKVKWEKTFGERRKDMANAIIKTSDNGYLVVGQKLNTSKTGGHDGYCIKLDSSGDTVWEKTYGGKKKDVAFDVKETEDGGFVISGKNRSTGAGNYDLWVFKLDKSGKMMWEKIYGGEDMEEGRAVALRENGGLLVAGFTKSKGAGKADLWILKLDDSGEIEKQYLFGKKGWESAKSVFRTSDSGFVVAGVNASKGAGREDLWIMKLDD